MVGVGVAYSDATILQCALTRGQDVRYFLSLQISLHGKYIFLIVKCLNIKVSNAKVCHM